MDITLSTGFALRRARGRPRSPYAPAVWAARLSTDARGVEEGRRWRGTLPRTTASRARWHALIEGLLHLRGAGHALTVHADLPLDEWPDEPGLTELARTLLARHDVQARPGPTLDADARALAQGLPLTRGSRRTLAADAWLPLSLPRLEGHYALAPDEAHMALVEIGRAGQGTVLCRVPAPFPFLGGELLFAPGGLRVPGSFVREVGRPLQAPDRPLLLPGLPAPGPRAAMPVLLGRGA